MLTFATTIVIIAFASIANGLNLEFRENDKICTAWQPVSNQPVNIDTSQCSSSLDYELKYLNIYMLRFCCTYRTVTQPGIGPAPSGCGRQAVAPIRTRIVGGQEAVPYSWPWLVSFQLYGNHFCGGTLIDQYHVLTAAHCFQDGTYDSSLTVVAGLHKRSNPNSQGVQRKQVARIVNHPQYNQATDENDVAIIRLASPVTLNSYVNIACLPGKDPATNEQVMIAGWGTTSYEGMSSDALKQANIIIMDNCQYVYNYDARKQVCAGNYQYSKDSCQGDSGGPLMYEVNGQWIVNGVVSFGDECAKPGYPGVYTRVSYYLPWIQSTISALSGK